MTAADHGQLGFFQDRRVAATNNNGGASSIWASSAGYSRWSHISKCWAGRASQANAALAPSRTSWLRRASALTAGKPSERQALAGALSAFEAQPNASINRRKRFGPSSGSLCKRSRASSSAGEISLLFIGYI